MHRARGAGGGRARAGLRIWQFRFLPWYPPWMDPDRGRCDSIWLSDHASDLLSHNALRLVKIIEPYLVKRSAWRMRNFWCMGRNIWGRTSFFITNPETLFALQALYAGPLLRRFSRRFSRRIREKTPKHTKILKLYGEANAVFSWTKQSVSHRLWGSRDQESTSKSRSACKR
jgi:hypothetical protein